MQHGSCCCDGSADEGTAGWIAVICYTDIFNYIDFIACLYIYIYMCVCVCVCVCVCKMVILLYCTLNVLSNLIMKQFENSRLDEEHLIVETHWDIKDFILD
jgi:hypothetical protein